MLVVRPSLLAVGTGLAGVNTPLPRMAVSPCQAAAAELVIASHLSRPASPPVAASGLLTASPLEAPCLPIVPLVSPPPLDNQTDGALWDTVPLLLAAALAS